MVERLRSEGPELIVLEATGEYELVCVAALVAAALPVVAVNPRQVRDFVRDFARATGQLAKTDRIDDGAKIACLAREGRFTSERAGRRACGLVHAARGSSRARALVPSRACGNYSRSFATFVSWRLRIALSALELGDC